MCVFLLLFVLLLTTLGKRSVRLSTWYWKVGMYFAPDVYIKCGIERFGSFRILHLAKYRA